ncbi:MAG TPA: helix-turn-helix domain-containing protein [Candidatus Binataceae bacterium]|nr:helix-turn-helix domain-containing protein [Candidatus Binataceae bacterium]
MTTRVNVLTVKEVSNYLRVHPSTVYRLSKNDELPAFRIGVGWRYNIEDIDRWRMEQSSNRMRMPHKRPTVVRLGKVIHLLRR